MNAERETAVAAVQSRTREVLGGTLSAQEGLAVSIAASCPRDRDAVLGFLLNTSAFRRVERHLDSVALTEVEWELLFGSKSVYAATAPLADVCKDASFREQERQIESSLRCSLVEAASKERWKSAASRVACYVALHSESAEERIAATLGGLVKSDSRRLDDSRSLLEEEGADEMLLCKAVLALAQCVCGK
jgi:hypothetical protein